MLSGFAPASRFEYLQRVGWEKAYGGFYGAIMLMQLGNPDRLSRICNL